MDDDEILKKQSIAIEKILKMIPFRASEVTPMKEYNVPIGYDIVSPDGGEDTLPIVLVRNGVRIVRLEYPCGAILETEWNGSEWVALRCNRDLLVEAHTKTVRIQGLITS